MTKHLLIAFLVLVFALTIAATAQTYTDLYNFDKTHGAYPEYTGLLAQGRDGNLYGTAPSGGTSGDGVAFEVSPTGALTVLYDFTNATGKNPLSGLTLGADGAFYGTTQLGGAKNFGTIFNGTPGAGTDLYSFTNGPDGTSPLSPPIQGTDGNFYGVTTSAYKITSYGTFTPLGSVPAFSYAPLVQASDGNFYGTTYLGGSHNEGTVFQLTAQGRVAIVHTFVNNDGEFPASPLIQASDGNLYGTASAGGSHGLGVVFTITSQDVLTVLHSFGDVPNDGQGPDAGLIQASDGNFYGVALSGGTSGYGVIFQITPAGAYSILYNFDGTHGQYPASTPVQHTNGKIYGTTAEGGTNGDGVLYSFDMGLPAFVKFVIPAGRVGATGGILGQGFTGTTAVSFNGTPATFTVVSDTYLTATVPAGATTGYVTVTTPSGTLQSNVQFRVIR